MTDEIILGLKSVKEDIQRKHSEIDAKLAGLASVEDVKAVTESLKQLQGLEARLLEIEQKAVSGVVRGSVAPESIGSQFIVSDEYKAILTGEKSRARVHVKNTVGNVDANFALPDRVIFPEYQTFNFDILSVIGTGSTQTNSVEVFRDLTVDWDAGMQAEKAVKKEADFDAPDMLQYPVQTIAHFIVLSKQNIADNALIASYIDGRLRLGLTRKRVKQILTGDGTGANLSGIFRAGNSVVRLPTAGDDILDSLNRAKNTLLDAEIVPNAVIMNPADWGEIERLKDTTGRYLIGNPVGEIVPVIWGLRVVSHGAVPAGKYAMANFASSTSYITRQGQVVELSESDGDNFRRNLVTMRAEERGTLVTFEPRGVMTGDLID
jgi:HK97 family phage major capsid protein